MVISVARLTTSVHWKVDRLDLSIGTKDFLDMSLVDILCQVTDCNGGDHRWLYTRRTGTRVAAR